MIEKRRLPLVRVVTDLTPLRLSRFRKLSRMSILVAPGTSRGRRFERGLAELAAGLGGLVAFVALQFHVSADERERRLGMIEAG